MRAAAILAAAGKGERLGGSRPKALVEIAGRPLIAYAVDALDRCPEIGAFVVAVPPGSMKEVGRVARGSPKCLSIVEGGESRQASIRVALRAVPGEFDAIVCHDVARPFASPALFSAVVAALGSADGIVPAVAVRDTVKRLRGSEVLETVSREGLGLAQTPQAFRREALEAAHDAAAAAGFEGTDDAGLLERAGFPVGTVPGDPRNVKVTTEADLGVAAALARG